MLVLSPEEAENFKKAQLEKYEQQLRENKWSREKKKRKNISNIQGQKKDLITWKIFWGRTFSFCLVWFFFFVWFCLFFFCFAFSRL
jgi:hypothetical protein